MADLPRYDGELYSVAMRPVDGARAADHITDEEYHLLASFRHALRRFLQFSERAAAQLGVTGQQYQALLAVRGFPGRSRVTVGELAERMCIQHHSAVGLVDRLSERDLVRRSASRGDRRHVFVELTSHGEKVLQELAAIHHAELQRIRPELLGVFEGDPEQQSRS